MELRNVAQPIAVLLCLSVILLLPASTSAQTTNDTVSVQNVISSLPVNQFSEVNVLNFRSATRNSVPLSESESSSASPTLAAPPAPPKGKSRKLPRLGIQFTTGFLGFGGQVATSVFRRANVRVGFNYFSYTLPTFHKDNASYKGSLNLRSFQADFDYYLFWGFHISPGGLLYNGNKVDATASIPNGQSFTLGGTQYTADGDITGTGDLPLNRAAPTLKIGFGNLLPRNRRHLTFNFDIGTVFQQAPKVGIALVGLACPGSTSPCASPVNVATDPTVQTNIASEEAKINKDLNVFKYYPIISFGIGWKF